MTTPHPRFTRPDTSLDFAILCGGQGKRMGGINKGLIHWQGKPIIVHLLDWIRTEYTSNAATLKPKVWLVTNTHATDYQTLVIPHQNDLNIQIIADRFKGYLGPLAGIDAALAASQATRIQLLPCDCPTPPLGLTARLNNAHQSEPDKQLWTPFDGTRTQPLFSQIKRDLHPSLISALEQNHLAVNRWMQQQDCMQVDCTNLGTFKNINQPSLLEDSA